MKAKIKQVLYRHKDSQGNLSSESFRDMLAVEIESNITKDNDKMAVTLEDLGMTNPLSIEMWKGYKPREEVTPEQQRNYDFIMSEMSDGEREHLENWKSAGNNNSKQMEIQFDEYK